MIFHVSESNDQTVRLLSVTIRDERILWARCSYPLVAYGQMAPTIQRQGRVGELKNHTQTPVPKAELKSATPLQRERGYHQLNFKY